MEPNDKNLSPLLEEHNFFNLFKGPTCFESYQGRCVDLLLTNKKHSFMMTQSFETGFSDHHYLIYTVFTIVTIRTGQRSAGKWNLREIFVRRIQQATAN